MLNKNLLKKTIDTLPDDFTIEDVIEKIIGIYRIENGTAVLEELSNNTNDLWVSTNESDWFSALEKYWSYVKPQNVELERELNDLKLDRIINMGPLDWYDFLHDEYFLWKYTAHNRYVTTTLSLRRYKDSDQLDVLFDIKQRLLDFDIEDISTGLSIAKEIRGLGIAGASGLLSLMYPNNFATVDQFAVKALCQIPGLSDSILLKKMNPDSITLKHGIVLINIMKDKAKENNKIFNTDFWTPRKVDMVLWALR
jgi:hypothetical protein